MLFNSLAFAIFLPLVVAVHFLLPQAWRRVWMLLAGHVFYMALVPWYILILWTAILLDWGAAQGIAAARTRKGRNLWLAASVTGTCSLLFVFKYYGFAAALAQPLAQWLHLPLPVVELVLPIGLSFHTFQSLAYVIEVHQGRFPAERNLGLYALYVLFFPQLVAGPIERPQQLLPQLRHLPDFDADLAVRGLRRMAWGFFLKVGVADRLAPAADAAFGNHGHAGALVAWLGLIAFAGQIYCDFAGYSEIARGCAEILGIRLMRNFSGPWGSERPSLFWRRWHISLSSWFRDYVYIPLGGGRVVWWRRDVNVLITFGLSGLWHGAAGGFVIWGLLNGGLVALERHLLPKDWAPSRFGALLGWALTSLAILPTWVFFRARHLSQAFGYFHELVHPVAGSLTEVLQQLSLSRTEALLCLCGLAGVWLCHRATQGDPVAWIGERCLALRWSLYWSLGFYLLLFGALDGQRFVYFQF